MSIPQINLPRLKENLLAIGEIGKSDEKGYTRLAYSEEEHKALDFLKEKLLALNVTVTQDRVGNVFGRYGDASKKSIAFGSHLDTVPSGGLYDGALGVMVGLECLQTLVENGYEDTIPYELICFVGEEANPLGGTFGSRALAGLIEVSADYQQKLEQFGFDRSDIEAVKKSTDDYVSFLEMHVEQGEVLKSNENNVGIVTAIAGILRFIVTIQGHASHSGTTPMNYRKDALLDASYLIQKVNQVAIDAASDIVATVGELTLSPNLANVVPGKAELLVEIRGGKWEEVKEVALEISDWINQNLDAEIQPVVEKLPSTLSSELQKRIEQGCQTTEANYQYMISGANHDANSLTGLTNVGMIFVPSENKGISHHPDEFTKWEDIEVGANVMLQTLVNISENLK